ncbi:hypothetical protein hamaS1_14340 [Moorella sp. Hama-1]|nr:hypothetical protein hamaS1_14340 [Moorella sp. Hama-1]
MVSPAASGAFYVTNTATTGEVRDVFDNVLTLVVASTLVHFNIALIVRVSP